ncbi:MAG: hypothetical protein IJ141_00670, partial [Lachnospiraceae bacterium]|nr:hypothetical protein [Lachnospiraceae bacterium]
IMALSWFLTISSGKISAVTPVVASIVSPTTIPPGTAYIALTAALVYSPSARYINASAAANPCPTTDI